ncbi:MAG: alpha/beta hydrolase [Anaerolineaceae bacterium]|nr:MAG: alpha/beta hydrolase [Anaerolineaceae bacterium]
MSVVFLDNAIVHYEVLGKGRPVFFLHGWVGSWKYWIPSMQVTSTSYRAYALDLWGFGETAHNQQAYHLDHQADMLSAFMDKMGIGKIAIVGHGLGGLVALNFARRWPKSVDRMMAVNCPMDYESVHTRLWTAQPVELVDWLSSRAPELVAALSDAGKTDPLAITVSMDSLQANNFFGAARQTNLPCLFVYGQNDPAIPPPSTEKQSAISHMMHNVIFDGSGHFPMMDETQKFNRLLIDFLALDSGVSPQELQLKEEWKRRVR